MEQTAGTLHPTSTHTTIKSMFSVGFKNYTNIEIRDIRNKLGYSRCDFGNMFFASVETVKGWEIGRRQPTCSAMRLMQFVEKLADVKHSDINHRIRQGYK